MLLFDSRNSALYKLRTTENVWTLKNDFVTVEKIGLLQLFRCFLALILG